MMQTGECGSDASAATVGTSRRTFLRALPAALVASALAPSLGACTRASEELAAEASLIPEVDFSGIEYQEDIAALLPEEIRARGELVNGAELSYAPGEFLSNGKAVGYDIDLLTALGIVFGLKTRTESAVFSQIIPAVGSKYDVVISGFTVNEERLQTVTMVSYFEAGISYAVKKGNPYSIDPHKLCGKRPAVQVGSYQEEIALAADERCRAEGQRPVDVLAYANNSDAVTNVAGGKADVLIADSPVTSYAIARSRGSLEQVGDVEESALNGIVVKKGEDQLAEALRAAVQHLIDTGALRTIMSAWGNDAGLIEKAEVKKA